MAAPSHASNVQLVLADPFPVFNALTNSVINSNGPMRRDFKEATERFGNPAHFWNSLLQKAFWEPQSDVRLNHSHWHHVTVQSTVDMTSRLFAATAKTCDHTEQGIERNQRRISDLAWDPQRLADGNGFQHRYGLSATGSLFHAFIMVYNPGHALRRTDPKCHFHPFNGCDRWLEIGEPVGSAHFANFIAFIKNNPTSMGYAGDVCPGTMPLPPEHLLYPDIYT